MPEVWQKSRIEAGLASADEKLERLLRKEPVEVAREASRPLRLLYRRPPQGLSSGF